MCTLSKCYDKCVIAVVVLEVKPLANFLYGYRKGRQFLDVVAPLVYWLRRAAEWHLPLRIVSLVVDAAFDNMNIEVASGYTSRTWAMTFTDTMANEFGEQVAL